MENNKKYASLNKEEKRKRQKEILKVFFKLGCLAFGGPAAHIAMMDEEIIKKKKWITREKFIDLLGATNLIPGPNSTELAIHLGFERGGVLGLFVAGGAFIFPAMAIILLFAYIYVQFGSIPQVESILYGVKPVIIVIILKALYRLGTSVIKNKYYLFFALIFIGIYILGVNEIVLLFLAGIMMMTIKRRREIGNKYFSISLLSGSMIFFIFLKIGSVLYGSGYVLLAFFESEFVDTGLITSQQLIDAVAIGQFTPGPVFTTATFVGYLLKGIPGAILATIGIFTPSFLLVWLLNPLISKLRSSLWISPLLDGVNIGAVALMAVVSFKLGVSSIQDLLTLSVFIVSGVAFIKYKINPPWLILAGGFVGFISSFI